MRQVKQDTSDLSSYLGPLHLHRVSLLRTRTLHSKRTTLTRGQLIVITESPSFSPRPLRLVPIGYSSIALGAQ
ncbi:hypothetical protein PGT21_022253 [Puccinia graminis f. sp. tritici]|uniref:Uncharacterized protein n=1 Tax=Puccinia graminis f. sp. tritici TaxID=56615 RepID=A0A5B0RIC6_PUCGR|nr:hypothetical protein PGT21_022253 [Puccinia graminis f. sp. tritici]KAA1124514.1 hypothetical protein PGTUg99_005386 [Puccinia graminis f. sp. tritici]